MHINHKLINDLQIASCYLISASGENFDTFCHSFTYFSWDQIKNKSSKFSDPSGPAHRVERVVFVIFGFTHGHLLCFFVSLIIRRYYG